MEVSWHEFEEEQPTDFGVQYLTVSSVGVVRIMRWNESAFKACGSGFYTKNGDNCYPADVAIWMDIPEIPEKYHPMDARTYRAIRYLEQKYETEIEELKAHLRCFHQELK